MSDSTTVVIIGTGRIATQFGRRMKAVGMDILQLYGRDKARTSALAEELEADAVADFSQVRSDADLYLLAVSDDAIAEVAARLPETKGLVVHTSGSSALSLLSAHRRGVIWPVRSMTHEMTVDWAEVQLVVESDDKDTHRLASSLSPNVTVMDAAQRVQAHLIAVILNNFTNHLLQMAHELSRDKGIAPQLFDDLLQQTVSRAREADPKDLQTGPARRGDRSTIGRQLQQLADRTDYQEVYRAISESIKKTTNGD